MQRHSVYIITSTHIDAWAGDAVWMQISIDHALLLSRSSFIQPPTPLSSPMAQGRIQPALFINSSFLQRTWPNNFFYFSPIPIFNLTSFAIT